MCGIIGFNWSDDKLLKEMSDLVSCRGPDDSGQFIDQNVSMGHRRLAIIDRSTAGRQPMESRKNDLIISYNGELYNYMDLRGKLKNLGYTFESNTDTEVVLKSYSEWGDSCLSKFNGMFAIVIYDKSIGELFLARDHIGIKPLYYYNSDKKFVFSSTIKPILSHEIETSPNRKAIRDFILINISDHLNETFFNNIRKIPKGSFAKYNLQSNDFCIEKWWEPEFSNDFQGSYSEAVNQLSSKLRESVRKRLISDVPVGTCLSGGIDSSSIASLISSVIEEHHSDTFTSNTFTATYSNFEYDESEYAELVCSETNLINHKTEPTEDDISSELMDFIEAIEQPVQHPNPFAQYKVFELAKDLDTTVLLDGQGSDELFAGYHLFYANYIYGLFTNGKYAQAIQESAKMVKNGEYRTGFISFLFLLAPKKFRDVYLKHISNIADDLFYDESATSTFIDEYSSCYSLHSALEFYLNYRLEHLLTWEDRTSMDHSREARVPFLDRELMEFVFTLPEEYIISDGVTKKILRDAMRGIVPAGILGRKDKIGYATPKKRWLKSESMEKLVTEWFINSDPKCEEYIDTKETKQIINEFYSGKESKVDLIWKTVFLEAWMRKFW